MAGSRRTQRSVRLTAAAGLVGASALVVIVALAVGSMALVSLAAVLSVLAGGAAARIVYNELLQTRRDWAQDRAGQAQSFRLVLAAKHAEQLAFSDTMAHRLNERDLVINSLTGTVGRATRRADEAEARVQREARRANDAEARVQDEVLRANDAEARVQDEVLRANESQDRLAALLDEVLGTAGYDVDADRQGDLPELPAIVELLGWDAKLKAS